MSIPRDVQEFLLEYPGVSDQTRKQRNLEFYRNVRRCQPDNMLIEELLRNWQDDFETLEYEHGFIQWLFPIREFGMNYDSQPLQKHEIEAMKGDEVVMQRLVRSYRLMLSFYGMELLDEETGLLSRSLQESQYLSGIVSHDGYRSRYRNLVRSPHNYLRISRILKCLSELGMEHMNAGFLLHVLCEQSDQNKLNAQHLRNSMDRWWINCIRNEHERLFINELVAQVRGGGRVFNRADYEQLLAQRKETGRLQWPESDTLDAIYPQDQPESEEQAGAPSEGHRKLKKTKKGVE
ncbi:SubName: Full=Uncharacterized protein {ECO:0000313/EMBL:CCA67834.1} [Serendipita indica DSM 11827]|uniref:Opioid growth factor receptor (OGFr) conserved domain-containing protein n=1 Tax=Serendipita indica (strain DSM 11827) TaxID=1109443 RepID=G4T944_SERID|nr:SubName: Full=Uncharacterized protein {ECO:0000313/EMBL:CCA67834.1} [Serendipita indica DSM 11827]CCA67834.1 hypothetical protein PIIN_01658 [Serendipita indica DSM 11827]